MRLASHTDAESLALVEELAMPYRAATAYKALLKLGGQALPAIRSGLRHSSADVRFHCCRFLDRYLQPDILPDLLRMLDDGDERVRMTTLHTLACDRCKDGSCRPEKGEVLPRALKLLAHDPSAHVRAMAIEVVGQFVPGEPSALSGVEMAARSDSSPAVRKKAGWYAPGGTIYRRSAPRNADRALSQAGSYGR